MKKYILNAVIIAALISLNSLNYTLQGSQQEETTKIEELKKYKTSIIQGEVVKILDEDEFRLKDSSGAIKVYTGWKNTYTVDKGEKVKVKGKLDPGIINEFYATEIIRENGEILKLKSD